MENEFIQAVSRSLLRENPEVEARIEHGTELNRKGQAHLILKHQDGSAVSKATVRFRQTGHEFKFGCNGFMYRQFDTGRKNEEYERKFKELFNTVVVPFYWDGLEPEPGKERFAKDSPKFFRRPAVDELLEWAESAHLTPKGHPLLWQCNLPSWLTADAGLKLKWEQRIRRIAERYGERIPLWDVVNEGLSLWRNDIRELPYRQVEFGFDLAKRYFPESAVLHYNDFNCWEGYNKEYTPLFMLVRHLLRSGRKVDGLGLQFHLMCAAFPDMLKWSEYKLNALNQFRMLDLYAGLGIPINISEITLTAHEMIGPDRFDFQAKMAERLYRLWFSHPALNGIVYWNLVDNTAQLPENPDEPVYNENKAFGGLLNNDAKLSEKPVFSVLKHLIRDEWNTSGILEYDTEKGMEYFRGFYGPYHLEIQTDSGCFPAEILLSSSWKNEFEITLPE